MMNCPKCNGRMTQYIGFNERCAAPDAPWECVKGCVQEATANAELGRVSSLTHHPASDEYSFQASGGCWVRYPASIHLAYGAVAVKEAVERSIDTSAVRTMQYEREIDEYWVFAGGLGDRLYVAIPSPQASAQPTQSQQASVATARIQPAPLNCYGGTLPLPQKKGVAWRILPPDLDDDGSALRTHQPQGGSHPVGLDKTRREWSREYLGQWCTTHLNEMSSDTLDFHSPDQTSTLSVYPYHFLVDRPSD